MIDRYTNFILTVIACLLAILIVRDIPLASTALAQYRLYKGETLAVTIRGIDECPSCKWEPLPVRVER